MQSMICPLYKRFIKVCFVWFDFYTRDIKECIIDASKLMKFPSEKENADKSIAWKVSITTKTY